MSGQKNGRNGTPEPSQISDAALYAIAGMSSASSAMFERRRRILKEAQHMLAENGVDGFSTMELSRRSGVAQRTIFNAFGNRDNLIAIAIRFYFEKFDQAVSERFDVLTLDGALGRIAAATLRYTQIRNYMAAVVGLYFSPAAPEPTRAVTLKIGAGFFLPWLQRLETERATPPHCDLHRLTRHLANIQYSVINDWLAGVIDEAAVPSETLIAVLQILAGALHGEQRALAERYLADVQAAGPLFTALMENALANVPHSSRANNAEARLMGQLGSGNR